MKWSKTVNPLEDVVRNFQQLVAQVPEFVQPFVVLLAGAVPFIEGEGASAIGVIGGLNPIVAGLAAASGNFLAVLIVVAVSSRLRTAAVEHHAKRAGAPVEVKPESKGRQRFRKWLVRFGVPGASLLGSLAIPTHFTSAILIASGTPRRWVLLWQGIAIVFWTILTTTLMWLAVTAVLG